MIQSSFGQRRRGNATPLRPVIERANRGEPLGNGDIGLMLGLHENTVSKMAMSAMRKLRESGGDVELAQMFEELREHKLGGVDERMDQ